MNTYKIAIIGAGNVSHQLTYILVNLGFEISWIWNRDFNKANELANAVECIAIKNLADQSVENTLIFMAVSDDAITEIAKSRTWESAYLVHTSGSYDSADLSTYVAQFGAFYPFQTIRKELELDWGKIPLFLEANTEELLAILVGIAELCSDTISYKTSEERKKLHLTGVITNNFVYHLLRTVKNFCEHESLPFEFVFPLFEQTATLAFNSDDDMQTGPAKRGDITTIKKHLQLLEKEPVLAKLYTELSQSIYTTYHDKKLEL